MIEKAEIRLKRVYQDVTEEDGIRVLVERLWPRGISREKLAAEHWFKSLAPSPDLRRCYNHQAERWPEFRRRYEAELLCADQRAMSEIVALCRDHIVTFVFGARDIEHNSAVVLRDFVQTQIECAS